MLDISLQPFLLRSIVASILISISVFGSSPFVAMRNLSFLVVEVAHAILCGAALGLFLNKLMFFEVIDPIWLALAFSVFFGLLTGYLGEKREMEMVIGVLFALNMALAVLFMSLIPTSDLPKIWGYLIGDLFLLTENDLYLLLLSSTLVGLLAILFWKEFTYISFDEEGAAAHGMNTRVYHYLMILSISIATVSAVRAIGAILVYALMVVPGVVALELASTTSWISIFSFLFAFISLLFGVSSSLFTGLPPSGIIGVILFLIYLTIIIKKKL